MKGKLLFIVASLGVGGAQKIGSFVMNECNRNGYDVHVYSLSDEPFNVDLDHEVGINYLNYNYKSKIMHKIEEIKGVYKHIKKINPDLVIIFGSYTFPSLGALLSKKTIIGCERGDPYTYTKLRQTINRKLYKKYKFSVFQSEGARDYYNLDSKKTKIIINPCFISNINNKGVKDEIVGAGRLTIDKGFDTLIKSFKQVKKEHPTYKLKIYGEGPYKQELEELVESLDMQNCVLFEGKVKNLVNYFEFCKIFVLSSWFEGLPNTLIEAMSTGVPIVSTDCSPGGARYLMKDGTVGGCIVPVKDVDAMAHAINKIINNYEKSRVLGELGRKRVNEFKPEKISAEWLDVIDKNIGKEREE